ncbi:MAG: hypothetical protein ABW082_17005 [Sedimenticola sp.]
MYSDFNHEVVSDDYFKAVECMEAAARAGKEPCDREYAAAGHCQGCPYQYEERNLLAQAV